MGKYNSEKFFLVDEKTKIEETIKDVEKTTSGELVVMVTSKSNNYRDLLLAGSIFFASLFSYGIISQFNWYVDNYLWGNNVMLEFFKNNSIGFFILLTLLLLIPFAFLFSKKLHLLRFFISKKRRNAEVADRAVRAFYKNSLYKTRDETGVLFLISLLERKLFILADKGIYEKLSQERLNQFASKLTGGIKNNNACDVICDVIKDSGKVLAENFPIKPDDTNELSNAVIIEK